MAKINIRESLGRLDLLTDNKYDLRNTYDSSNISNDKKKKLAESLNNNASAKQIYNILNESFEEPGISVTEAMKPSDLERYIMSVLKKHGFDYEHGYSPDFITDYNDNTKARFIEAQFSDGLDWNDYKIIKKTFKNSGIDVYPGKEHKDGDLLSVVFEVSDSANESLTEDTVKQNGKWVNKGSEGTHGKFKTKKAADAQRRAIWVNWNK